MGEVVAFPVRDGFEPELPKIATAREIGVCDRTLERWVRLGCPHRRLPDTGHLRFVPSKVIAWRDEQTDRSDDGTHAA